MSKKRKAPKVQPLPTVSFRTIEVNFLDRTIKVNGRSIGPIEAPIVTFPILEGAAVFMARDMERVG